MASFDGHMKCARCRDKGIGEDYCVLKKDCSICKGFTPEQIHQLSTLNLNVDFCVANAYIVTGLLQRKGVNPNCCQMYTEIKYVKDVSCVGHLSSVNLVTNAQPVVMDPPVEARLHNFGEKWEALGSSPKVVTTLRAGFALPFRFRPNLTRSPTVISNYHNPSKQAHLLEALYQLVNKNAVEPVENQNSLGFYNRLFLVPKPNNR